jgi:hypothetical protein
MYTGTRGIARRQPGGGARLASRVCLARRRCASRVCLARRRCASRVSRLSRPAEVRVSRLASVSPGGGARLASRVCLARRRCASRVSRLSRPAAVRVSRLSRPAASRVSRLSRPAASRVSRLASRVSRLSRPAVCVSRLSRPAVCVSRLSRPAVCISRLASVSPGQWYPNEVSWHSTSCLGPIGVKTTRFGLGHEHKVKLGLRSYSIVQYNSPHLTAAHVVLAENFRGASLPTPCQGQSLPQGVLQHMARTQHAHHPLSARHLIPPLRASA